MSTVIPVIRDVPEMKARVAAARLGGLDQGVTFSAGVSCAGPGAGTLDALLHAADQALYQAKHDGRNRTVLAAATA